MQLLGSVICLTSAFYSLEGVVYLVHWTHSFFVISYYIRIVCFARWDVP